MTRAARTILAALALLAPASASAQSVTAEVPSGNVTRFEVAGPARVEYSGRTITIVLGEGPAPNPNPAPGPPAPEPPPPLPPGPAPVAPGKLYVTLIFDPAAETAEQAKARSEMATALEWKDLDAEFRAYSVDDRAIDDRNLRKSIGSGTLPLAIVQRQPPGADTAPIVTLMPRVEGKAAVLKATKEARGGR